MMKNPITVTSSLFYFYLRGLKRMRKEIIIIILVVFNLSLKAQEKTFEREYTYYASEIDSKVSCRAIALNEIRLQLLGEIGLYIQSENILETEDTKNGFKQDFSEKILTLTAGITKVKIIEEKWDGDKFWIKASISVDENSLKNSLTELINDKAKTKELEGLRKQLLETSANLLELKNQINELKDKNKLLEQYNIKINNLSYSDYMYNGMERFTKADYLESIKYLNKAIEVNPKDGYPYFLKGLCNAGLLNYNAGIENLNDAINLKYLNQGIYKMRGNFKGAISDFQGAIIDFHIALDFDDTDFEIYYLLANAYYAIENFSDAIESCNKSILLNPDNENAYYIRGKCKASLKDYKNSLSDFSKSLRINPSNSKVYFARGVTKARMGNIKEGCLDLKTAAELGNQDAVLIIEKHCK